MQVQQTLPIDSITSRNPAVKVAWDEGSQTLIFSGSGKVELGSVPCGIKVGGEVDVQINGDCFGVTVLQSGRVNAQAIKGKIEMHNDAFLKAETMEGNVVLFGNSELYASHAKGCGSIRATGSSGLYVDRILDGKVDATEDAGIAINYLGGSLNMTGNAHGTLRFMDNSEQGSVLLAGKATLTAGKLDCLGVVCRSESVLNAETVNGALDVNQDAKVTAVHLMNVTASGRASVNADEAEVVKATGSCRVHLEKLHNQSLCADNSLIVVETCKGSLICKGNAVANLGQVFGVISVNDSAQVDADKISGTLSVFNGGKVSSSVVVGDVKCHNDSIVEVNRHFNGSIDAYDLANFECMSTNGNVRCANKSSVCIDKVGGKLEMSGFSRFVGTSVSNGLIATDSAHCHVRRLSGDSSVCDQSKLHIVEKPDGKIAELSDKAGVYIHDEEFHRERFGKYKGGKDAARKDSANASSKVSDDYVSQIKGDDEVENKESLLLKEQKQDKSASVHDNGPFIKGRSRFFEFKPEYYEKLAKKMIKQASVKV